MTAADASDAPPPLVLRMLRFPLVRLPLLGGALYLLMGIKNGFMETYAGSPLTALALVLAMAAAGMAVYVGFVRLVERRPVTELSLPGMGRELGGGMLLGFGLYAACALIAMLLGVYRIDGLNPWVFLLPALPMAIGAGVLEELIHRGVVFRVLEEVLGSWTALAAASLVFGLAHLGNPDATLRSALVVAVEAGVLLAAAFMLTRRLWLAMGVHMAWNYTQAAVFSGAVSGIEMPPGLIRATIDGPDLLTGGIFGLEASVIAFLLCAATGAVFLVMAARRGRIAPAPWLRRT